MSDLPEYERHIERMTKRHELLTKVIAGLTVVVLGALMVLLHTWVIQTLWNYTLVDQGLKPLTLPKALAVSILTGFLTGNLKFNKKEEPRPVTVNNSVSDFRSRILRK